VVVCKYLTWLSIPTKSFNVGQYRRDGGIERPPASFFDLDNPEGLRLRELAAEAAFKDILEWFSEENGVVAILDATNSTRNRRAWILGTCQNYGIEVMFVESICNDEKLVMSNILDVKVTSPDYQGWDLEEVPDFQLILRDLTQ